MQADGERWLMNAMMGRERHATVDAMIDAAGDKTGFVRLGPSPLQRLLDINAQLGREQASAAQLISRLQQENGEWERVALELRSELAKMEQSRSELTAQLRRREAETHTPLEAEPCTDMLPTKSPGPTRRLTPHKRTTVKLLIEAQRAEREQLHQAQEAQLKVFAATLIQAHTRRWGTAKWIVLRATLANSAPPHTSPTSPRSRKHGSDH